MSTTPAFTVRVPPSWYEFDVWRATRTGDLARLVDRRIAEDQRLARYRPALLKALREAAEQAERHGAVLCAAMTEPRGQDVLTAMLTVFHTEGSPDPAANTVPAIAAQITAREDGSQWRRVETVELAAGPAARVSGVESIPFGERQADCVLMQTLIPAPAGGVLNLTLSSHQTELQESWLDLFDAISSTLAWNDAT
ncbi:hypothetical protein [Kineosporia babensis]|uniref:Uncharacterized protein n=1 Tax=Kineosporia babensis TaxID=499548 RepID=A0A9X1NJ12_9ACTN|nr:hypothetical protein [Kineosporia babensis]MCD5315932.1 hypothetical protein [Kineosporia babensis]